MKIKPCPFCGEQGRVGEDRDGKARFVGWFVNCNNKKCLLHVSTKVYSSKKEAIAIWNKRGGIKPVDKDVFVVNENSD